MTVNFPLCIFTSAPIFNCQKENSIIDLLLIFWGIGRFSTHQCFCYRFVYSTVILHAYICTTQNNHLIFIANAKKRVQFRPKFIPPTWTMNFCKRQGWRMNFLLLLHLNLEQGQLQSTLHDSLAPMAIWLKSQSP